MDRWEEFENLSIKFLNSNLSDLDVNMISTGSKNSNNTDIAVVRGKSFLFNIEVKLSPCQSGQIVIKKKDNSFEVSEKIKNNNSNNQIIIENINENLNYYIQKGENYFELDKIEKKILFNWIKEHYISKKAYFIITSTELNSFYGIIPINEINKYFEVSAVVRIKQSGTRHIPQSKIDKIKIYLKKHLEENNIYNYEIKTENKKTLLKIIDITKLTSKQRYFNNIYLSPIEKNNINNIYYVKNRSNTFNLNVVFSLNYIGDNHTFGIDNIKNYIKLNF